MSSTNKTTNYELSQYIGSDKPTYLGDYNSDMLKIDTQMKNNADNIASVSSTATTANTTAGTALTNAAAAQTTADNANTTAANASNVSAQALSKATTNETNISKILSNNAGSHTCFYRGANITTDFYNGTLSQQIANGTFDDIFIGDYIIGQVSETKYIVADINYELNTGDTTICNTPHIVLIPETIMGKAQMNASNIVTGAYIGSSMYTTNLDSYKTIISNDFGAGHILATQKYLKNAVSNGAESGGGWYSTTVDIMNEVMIYGTNMSKKAITDTDSGRTQSTDKTQLAIFRYRPDLIVAYDNNNERQAYWLRDVNSTTAFCYVAKQGMPSGGSSSYSLGVRPVFMVY